MTITEQFRLRFERIRGFVAPGTLPAGFVLKRWGELTSEQRAQLFADGLRDSYATFVSRYSTAEAAFFVIPDGLASFDGFLADHEIFHAHEHYAELRRLDLGQRNTTPSPLQQIWTARGLERIRPLAEQQRIAGSSYDPTVSPKELYADAGARAVADHAQVQANEERLIAWNEAYAAARGTWDGEAMRRAFAAVAAAPSSSTSTQPAPAEPAPSTTHDDPIGWLLSFPVTRRFGDMSFPQFGAHTGVDLGLPAGTPVYAIADGVVVIDDDDAAYDQGDARTWSGIAVSYRIAEDGTTVTVAHLERNDVQHGQFVREGRMLGRCGSTGASTGPHAHVETRLITGELVDPITYMEDRMFTPEDRAKLHAIHDALHPGGERSWLDELYDKINAGFNTTLATWLRRVVLGRDPVLKNAPVVDPDK